MDKKIIKLVGISFVIILSIILIIRMVSPHQMDDVSPERLCEERFLEKSDVLMVIPLLGNKSIAENQIWCEKIRGLNKTLGMHGIYHNRKEFSNTVDRESIFQGMEEFNKCFGFHPTIFEAPELSLSEENEVLLREMNFTIIKRSDYIVHKAYHCTDQEKKSWLVKLNLLNKIL